MIDCSITGDADKDLGKENCDRKIEEQVIHSTDVTPS